MAGTSLAGVVCFQLYYYNSTAPLTLNLTQALSIPAFRYPTKGYYSNQGNFNGLSNFTVIPSQNQLVIGGPSNVNEGATIAYALMAKSGASGKYAIGFIGWMLTPQKPIQCPDYLTLVAGTGQPYYILIGSCRVLIAPPINSTSTATGNPNYHTLTGIPYGLLNGVTYFRITAIANSTQIGGIG